MPIDPFEFLSEQDRATLSALLAAPEAEANRALHAMRAQDFLEEPATPMEFLFDDQYLGKAIGSILWDPWVEPLTRVMDPRNAIYEWILTGSIGSGKSMVATAAMCYRIHYLACMRDPYDFFGQSRISRFFFGVYNVFKFKGSDLYEKLKEAINSSPWFRAKFPVNNRKKDTIEFPRHVTVVPGASEIDTLGENLIACHMSELNFMRLGATKEDLGQAWKIYHNARRRIRTRFMFQGYTPGLMILDSSRRAQTDMLEQHLESVRDDPNVLISEGAVWDFKPKYFFMSTSFKVALGDERRMSKILGVGEEAPLGTKVVEVPDDFRDDFESDMDGALRDYAGVATSARTRLIRDRDRLALATDPQTTHPFTQDAVVLGTYDTNELVDFCVRERLVTVQKSRYVPRSGHGRLRFLHGDLSKSGDSAAIAMGYVEDVVWRNNRTQDLDIPEQRLLIRIELMMKILPPRDGEICFAKIRRFISALRDMGFVFGKITFDGWQSVDMIQTLNTAGFKAEELSIDRAPSAAYIMLRQAIQDRRVTWYSYPFLQAELVNLELDMRTMKVDHPAGGSKDVSDCVAGVVHSCMKTPGSAEPIPTGSPQQKSRGDDVPVRGAPKGKEAPFPSGQLIGSDYKG